MDERYVCPICNSDDYEQTPALVIECKSCGNFIEEKDMKLIENLNEIMPSGKKGSKINS